MDFAQLAALSAEPTPRHLGQFIVEYLEVNGPSKRGAFIEAAEREWLSVSGRRFTSNLTASVKKALSDLTKQEVVRPSGAHGVWVLAENGAGERDDEESVGALQQDTSESAFGELEEVAAPRTSIERDIGNGPHLVYTFYLDVYRAAAESRGESRWPIKIGMTTGQLDKRMETHRTALPESPRVPLVIRHENAAVLERVLHGILLLRGHALDSVATSEWFLTNPDELEGIYRFVMGQDARM
ncbi:GIY-YIG nuclease family protein [Actinomycetospora succinea]|uniref:GIY-YIG nuclease family protein n=1 Tax=Actinomycetospora succinea TaxID=663603 RepID=UPI001061E090|nr:GIY-YIG nuclease family protein [Actinomycetospora succinea]